MLLLDEEPTPEELALARAAALRGTAGPGMPPSAMAPGLAKQAALAAALRGGAMPPPGALAAAPGATPGSQAAPAAAGGATGAKALADVMGEEAAPGPQPDMARQAALAAALRGAKPNAGAYDLFNSGDEDAVRQQALGINKGLGRQRAAGGLGVLTGDRILANFGQAQLQGADQQEDLIANAGQFRAGQVLKQALAAKEAERDAAKQAHADVQRQLDRDSQERAAAIASNDKAMAAFLQAERDRLAAEERARNKFNDDVKDFGKEVADSGAPEFFERVDTAKGIFTRYPKDLPGFGAGGFIPDVALDAVLPPAQAEDARRLRQSVGQALASYQKFITGAGASDAERKNLTNITGLLQSGNEQSVRLGMRQLEAAMEAAMRARAGAHTPEAVNAYADRVPRIGNIIRETPTAALPTGSDGNPTLDAPAPKPAAGAKAKPLNAEPFKYTKPPRPKPGGVYMFNTKGEAFWVPEANAAKAREKGWKDVP